MMKRPIEAVIEDVIIEPDKIQPIIVNFQNGELKDEEAKNMKCGLYRDEKNERVLAMCSNDNIVYKGIRPNLDKELTYTMLAIHNKKTGKVRLVQAERWNVSPVLDSHVDLNVKDEDMLYELNTQFAIKKVQRKTEQIQKMKIDVNTAKDDYKQKAAAVNIDLQSLEASVSKDDLDGIDIPQCNRDADNVSKVYNINEIVPENILLMLYDKAKEVLEEDLSDKPDFFVQTVENYRENEDRIQKIAILLYIDAVTTYLNVPIKKKDSTVSPYPSEISNHIINTYSVPSTHGRLRPNSMKDKGVLHCIVLGLTIWNYSLDLELLSSMLKFRMGVKKLLEFSRLLCAMPNKDDKQRVTLKLPLPAEIPRIMKKRKSIKR